MSTAVIPSQSIENVEGLTDLPQSVANAAFTVGVEFGDFAECVIADNLAAQVNGWRVVNAYEKPDGREKEGQSIKTWPTDVSLADIEARIARLRTLARLAARAAQIEDADMSAIEVACKGALASLGSLDRDLWDAWVRSEKAHLPGPVAALLDVDGFAWTSSRKGHVAEIRYREDAQSYNRANRPDHSYMEADGYLSESDLAELGGWDSES